MFNLDLFKFSTNFYGPEAGGKSPEPQKKSPEAAKDNPNDLSKPVNREKLYKKADDLIAKLEKKGDQKSKKQAESLKKMVSASRETEKQKGPEAEKIPPQEIAEILKTELESILNPAQSVVFAPDKLTTKDAADIKDARSFGMIGLLSSQEPPVSEFEKRAKSLDGKPLKGGYEGALAEAIKDKPKEPAKIETAPIVISAKPINEPPKPYNILPVTLSSIPMSARVDARNAASNGLDNTTRYYAATDGKTYRARIGKSVDGQSIVTWNRIERQA
jgi:hypothetical protein